MFGDGMIDLPTLARAIIVVPSFPAFLFALFRVSIKCFSGWKRERGLRSIATDHLNLVDIRIGALFSPQLDYGVRLHEPRRSLHDIRQEILRGVVLVLIAVMTAVLLTSVVVTAT